MSSIVIVILIYHRHKPVYLIMIARYTREISFSSFLAEVLRDNTKRDKKINVLKTSNVVQ
jgi:hypothetical protein